MKNKVVKPAIHPGNDSLNILGNGVFFSSLFEKSLTAKREAVTGAVPTMGEMAPL